MDIIGLFSNPIFLGIMTIWTLPWKGIALWKASQNKQK